jgi:hypothetical protein
MFRKKPASSPVAFKGGGEENEKKLFVGCAKNTHHALPGNESQAVIYNCTALCATKGLRRRKGRNSLYSEYNLVPKAIVASSVI